jgi:hypothetical protein
MTVQDIDNSYVFNCPHCDQKIQVLKNQINCRIFRCGIYKNNGNPIPPHTSKIECDRLKNSNLIYGCSKPFKFVTIDNINNIEICNYI